MLKNYIKIAWKVLGRNKFFTFVSLFGISFTLAILLVVTTFLDYALNPKYPDEHRNRCVYVQSVRMSEPDFGSSQSAASFYFLERYVKEMKTPEMVAIVSNRIHTNTFVGNRKLDLKVMLTCENFWDVHSLSFVEGRPYTLKEIEDNAFVAVISEATRDQYFSPGAQVVGKTIEAGNVKYQVIGVVENVPVMQPFSYADIYAPYNTTTEDLQRPGFLGNYNAVLLAHDRKSIQDIKAEFDDMVARIEVPKDSDYSTLTSWAYTYIEIFTSNFFRSNEPKTALFFALLFGAMFLFMLLPALNLVNLNTSRIMERASEIGVRKAFGATTANLTTQFLIENVVLTLIGGAVGLILAFLLLNTLESSGVIPYAKFPLNFTVFLAGILLCVFFWNPFRGVASQENVQNANC